ncbi:MAG TPA: hypothetical protein VLF59_05045 [Candidatus Saccharimonadales bacterium]|nr:hypothetical protein [Candidatus Saccharimonadales bacterium]
MHHFPGEIPHQPPNQPEPRLPDATEVTPEPKDVAPTTAPVAAEPSFANRGTDTRPGASDATHDRPAVPPDTVLPMRPPDWNPPTAATSTEEAPSEEVRTEGTGQDRERPDEPDAEKPRPQDLPRRGDGPRDEAAQAARPGATTRSRTPEAPPEAELPQPRRYSSSESIPALSQRLTTAPLRTFDTALALSRQTTLVAGVPQDIRIAYAKVSRADIVQTANVTRDAEAREGLDPEPIVIAAIHLDRDLINSSPVPSNDAWGRMIRHVVGDVDDLLQGLGPEEYAEVFTSAATRGGEMAYGGLEIVDSITRSLARHSDNGQVNAHDVRQALLAQREFRRGPEYPQEVPTLSPLQRKAVEESLPEPVWKEQNIGALVALGQWASRATVGVSPAEVRASFNRQHRAAQQDLHPQGLTFLDLPLLGKGPISWTAETALKLEALRASIGRQTPHGRLVGAIITGADNAPVELLQMIPSAAARRGARLLMTLSGINQQTLQATAAGSYGIMKLPDGPQALLLQEHFGQIDRADLTSRTDTRNAGVAGGYHGNRTRTYKKGENGGKAKLDSSAAAMSNDDTSNRSRSVATTETYTQGPRYHAHAFGSIDYAQIVPIDHSRSRGTLGMMALDHGRQINNFPSQGPNRVHLDVLSAVRRDEALTDRQRRQSPGLLPEQKNGNPHLPAANTGQLPPVDPALKGKDNDLPIQKRQALEAEWTSSPSYGHGRSVRGLRGIIHRKAFVHDMYLHWERLKQNGTTKASWENWAMRRSIPHDGSPFSSLWSKPMRYQEVSGDEYDD